MFFVVEETSVKIQNFLCLSNSHAAQKPFRSFFPRERSQSANWHFPIAPSIQTVQSRSSQGNERTNERKQKKNRTAPFQAKIKLKNLRKFWSSSACVETSNNKKKKWKKWNFSKPKNSEIVFHALKITKKKGKLWKGGSKNSAKVLLFWPHLCHCEESVYL